MCCSSSTSSDEGLSGRCDRPPGRGLGHPTGPEPGATLEDQGRAVRFLVRDRDDKFVGPFDEVMRSTGARVIKSPVRPPGVNVFAERFCADSQDRMPGLAAHWQRAPPGPRAREFVGHYNHERPHRGASTSDRRSPTWLSPSSRAGTVSSEPTVSAGGCSTTTGSLPEIALDYVRRISTCPARCFFSDASGTSGRTLRASSNVLGEHIRSEK